MCSYNEGLISFRGGRAALAHGMANTCDNMMIMIGEFTVHVMNVISSYFINVNLFLRVSGKGIFQLRR